MDTALWNRVTSLKATAQVGGIVVGALTLLLLNLPWFAVGGRTVWWWSLFDAPHSTELVVYCFFLLFASIALCLIAPMVSGLARGISLLSLAAAAVVFTLVVYLGTPWLGLLPFAASYLLPALAASVVAISLFRSWGPSIASVRVFQAVFGGLCAAIAVTTTIFLLADTSREMVGLPGLVVFAFVVQVLACLAALAAGIVAAVGAKPEFSRPTNLASIVLATVSLGSAGVAQLLVAIWLADITPPFRDLGVRSSLGGAMFFLVFRFTAIEAGMLWLLIGGWMETLAATHFGQAFGGKQARPAVAGG